MNATPQTDDARSWTSVSFVIEGGYLTKVARDLYLEGAWRKALRTLDCLEGLGTDLAIEVIRGRQRLTGDSSTGIDIEAEDTPESAKIADQETCLYGNIAEESDRYYRPYAVVRSTSSIPALLWRRQTGKDHALVYADDPDRDRATQTELYGRPDVLFKRCDGPPHWFPTATLHAVAARDEAVEGLPDRTHAARVERLKGVALPDDWLDTPEFQALGRQGPTLYEMAGRITLDTGIDQRAASGTVAAILGEQPDSFEVVSAADLSCGYILRSGECYACEFHAHRALAAWLLTRDGEEAEDPEKAADARGWIRVSLSAIDGANRAAICAEPSLAQWGTFEAWAESHDTGIGSLEILETETR